MGAPRRYGASVILKLVLPIGRDYDTDLLEQQVQAADSVNPWRARYVNGKPARSIHWMSEIGMKEGEWIDRIYTVEIRPPFPLTLDQAYAYEKYGDTLAKTLATIVSSPAVKVDSRLVLHGMFTGGYRPSGH